MATRRIFAASGAVYHCMSRTVNGERLFDDVAKEVLRKQIRQVSAFCGVQVITYAIMANHFHILVRVAHAGQIADAELIRRYRILYPKPTRHATAHAEVLESVLASGGPDADALRKRLKKLMGDLSAFMKILKQRFSVWYNRSHRRYGTLWAERFTSTLVEGAHHAMKTVAAYIDLNPVRAGLVSDPAEYRFSGYGEACASGDTKSTHLYMTMANPDAPEAEILAQYRRILYIQGVKPKSGAPAKAARLTEEAAETVENRQGRMTLPQRLRLRVGWMTAGVAIGSQAFVREQLEHYRRTTGLRRKTALRPPVEADWGGLLALRKTAG